MSKTPERAVKDKIVKILKSHGSDIYYFSPIGGAYSVKGVPDIICCVSGRFLAIECKAGKNKPTELQQMHIEKINTAGGVAVVINEGNLGYLEGVIKLLKDK